MIKCVAPIILVMMVFLAACTGRYDYVAMEMQTDLPVEYDRPHSYDYNNLSETDLFKALP